MPSPDLKLLAQAGEELAVMLEMTYGYPDNPRHLLEANPEATSVVLQIFRLLIENGEDIPGPVAFLACHMHSMTDELSVGRQAPQHPRFSSKWKQHSETRHCTNG